MCFWVWPRYSCHSRVLWAVLTLVSTSLARAAEAAPRTRAAASAILVVVVVMVVSPMIAAHTVLVCMRILLARARPVNQLDVLISLIVESGRDAEKPR